MTEERDIEMEKYAAFCTLIVETEVVLAVDQKVPGVILPRVLMDPARTQPVDLIVSLANDPNTIADEEGVCFDTPTGFQAVIPWSAVFHISDLHKDDDEQEQYYWEDDDPGTKEFKAAFDEPVGERSDPMAAVEEALSDADAIMDRMLAQLPRDPEKPPLPIKEVAGTPAAEMAKKLQEAHADWKKKQEAKDAREKFKKTLTVHTGRSKVELPTEPKTGHLRIVKNEDH